jgi:myo-inositol-1(or 4)-monophosphatase
LALVACGKIDAAFALNPKWEWDVAAGALLVTEAGGCATTPSGRPLAFNTPDAKVQGFLAAAPNLHQMLSKRLSDAAQNLRTAHGMRV